MNSEPCRGPSLSQALAGMLIDASLMAGPSRHLDRATDLCN